VKVQKRPMTYEAIQVDLSPEGLPALTAFLGGRATIQHDAGAEPVLVVNGDHAHHGDFLLRDHGIHVVGAGRFTLQYMPAEGA
jgi:hypothetical protein